MKPYVYIARDLPEEAEHYLAEHCEIGKWCGRQELSSDELCAAAADAEGLLVTGTPVGEEVLRAAPKLRVVSNLSVGYNNLDLDALRARGIVATHTPFVLDETVADLAFALLLSAARRVAELDRYVKEGRWEKGGDEHLFGTDVHHATLGVIGMGRIGAAVARRARLGFLMNVLYHDRSRKPELEEQYDMAYGSLEEVLQQSDYVVLLTPLTKDTRRLMGRQQFAMMKPNAIFINVSRGENVDEEALVEALREKRIRGAGLDVYENEPIAADHPLLELRQVVTLPHLGSATAQTRLDMAMAAVRNLVNGLYGRTPVNVIPELK